MARNPGPPGGGSLDPPAPLLPGILRGGDPWQRSFLRSAPVSDNGPRDSRVVHRARADGAKALSATDHGAQA